MNEWDRLHRMAEHYKAEYPSGTRIMLLSMGEDIHRIGDRCFDHISHRWILEHIPIDKKILRKWLKCGYIETKKLFPTDEGAPQGSPISPVICNMVLDGLQPRLKKHFHQTTRMGKQYSPMVNFVRFADDFII